MSMSMSTPTFMAALLVVGVVGVGVGCKRPCETADNCKRTCECVNANTDTRLDCTMGFRCEQATLECEDDYDALPCAEVCNEYAAAGKCGFQRCRQDAECVRVATCPILDANGQPTALNFECTLNFTCEVELGLCSPGSEIPLDQMCLLPNPADPAQRLCQQPPT